MDQLLARINNLKPWQVACIISTTGLCFFSAGLGNPFANDDAFQIVNNPPVHSIVNLLQFFQSSTYWNGQVLTGSYYRPMMTTVFSIIYTVFGAQPVAYHIVQLAVYLASAYIVYLVFKHFFKPALALFLALIFVVHPLNSQVVYSIATMQDVLFFFFGILAVWLLIQHKTIKVLWAVATCLLLAMLSKESGIVFVALTFCYLLWFERKRIRSFVVILIVPVTLYLALKIHAVGLSHMQRVAPIDSTNLLGRLFTMPSLVLFYFSKFVFPWWLATTYYWIFPKFSVGHVLLPLFIDLAIIGLFIYLGMRIHRMLPRASLHTFTFFATWTVLGMVLYMQIIPLDMTACETWFYFAMAGLLGMIGVALGTVKVTISPVWLFLLAVLYVGVLGFRSTFRASDYQSQYTLAVHDLAASSDDYTAMNSISQYLIDRGNYSEAAVYAQRSINVYPVVANYNLLGVALERSGDYSGAVQAYTHALRYNNLSVIYENLGLILMVYSSPITTNQFFVNAITLYPQDYKLWVYLSLFEGAEGNTASAKVAIQNAAKFGSVSPLIYSNIMNEQVFALPILGKTLIIR
jgi:hypothetical protein